ncbi:uncharacterized protein LOC122637211 [Vespula pensylvanica]|uniref:uncharacterized protein LOC122637211 n=1 Tax=Vespula pensylvanica TaxID=30213 RepID=UPI001CBA075E|nr:uncharacterized protein LOC122637211 [Vespula pensylvanica]
MTFSRRLLYMTGIWPLEVRESLCISCDKVHQNFSLRYRYRNGKYGCSNGVDEDISVTNKVSMVIIMFPWTTLLLFSYYFRIVIPNMILVMKNATTEYILPYKIKPLVEPYDKKSYVFGCVHEFIRIIMVISGYLGTDCFFTTTGLHLTGQLAVLKCKVKNILNDADGPRKAIRKVILGHHRLIRLADLLEDSFNIIIGQHLFGTTILLCISSYRMLSSLASTETGGIMTYVVYAFLLMWKLLIYCYVGESLLTEVINRILI